MISFLGNILRTNVPLGARKQTHLVTNNKIIKTSVLDSKNINHTQLEQNCWTTSKHNKQKHKAVRKQQKHLTLKRKKGRDRQKTRHSDSEVSINKYETFQRERMEVMKRDDDVGGLFLPDDFGFGMKFFASCFAKKSSKRGGWCAWWGGMTSGGVPEG